jgi:hypothetical protein
MAMVGASTRPNVDRYEPLPGEHASGVGGHPDPQAQAGVVDDDGVAAEGAAAALGGGEPGRGGGEVGIQSEAQRQPGRGVAALDAGVPNLLASGGDGDRLAWRGGLGGLACR